MLAEIARNSARNASQLVSMKRARNCRTGAPRAAAAEAVLSLETWMGDWGEGTVVFMLRINLIPPWLKLRRDIIFAL